MDTPSPLTSSPLQPTSPQDAHRLSRISAVLSIALAAASGLYLYHFMPHGNGYGAPEAYALSGAIIIGGALAVGMPSYSILRHGRTLRAVCLRFGACGLILLLLGLGLTTLQGLR